MILQSGFTPILITDQFALMANASQSSLRIRLRIKAYANHVGIYQAKLKSLDEAPLLKTYFDDFFEVLQFIETPNNSRLDTKKLEFTILANSLGKKKKSVQLLTMKFILIETILQDDIYKIVRRCDKDQELSSLQIKNYMKTIAFYLKSTKGLVGSFQIEDSVNQKQYKLKMQELKNIIERQQVQYSRSQHFKHQNNGQQIQEKLKNIYQEIYRSREEIQSNIFQKLKQGATQFEHKLEEISKCLQQLNQEKLGKSQCNVKIANQVKKSEEKLFNKIGQNMETFIQLIKKIATKQQTKILSQRISRLQSKLQEKFGKVLNDIPVSKLTFSEPSINLKVQRQSMEVSCLSQPKNVINPLQWVDPQCYHYGNLKFVNNLIIAKSFSPFIFGQVDLKQKNYFTVVINTMNYHIALGLIDAQYKKHEKLASFPNKISYRNDGLTKIGRQTRDQEGKGFSKGEIVVVYGDMTEGKVEWRVGQDIRYSVDFPPVKDDTISWVPYIWLCDKNDSVIVISQP